MCFAQPPLRVCLTWPPAARRGRYTQPIVVVTLSHLPSPPLSFVSYLPFSGMNGLSHRPRAIYSLRGVIVE